MTHAIPSATSHPSRVQYLSLAVAASAVQMLMMIPGYSENGSFQTSEWLIVLGISIAVGLVLFSLVVPGGGTVTGIVLGAVAVVSVLVFWAGITLPLGAAAGVVGWRTRQEGEHRTRASIALALSAMSVVLLVAIIVADAMAN